MKSLDSKLHGIPAAEKPSGDSAAIIYTDSTHTSNSLMHNVRMLRESISSALTQIQEPKDTELTTFFKLCPNDSFAKTLLYSQVPSYYIWKKGNQVNQSMDSKI